MSLLKKTLGFVAVAGFVSFGVMPANASDVASVQSVTESAVAQAKAGASDDVRLSSLSSTERELFASSAVKSVLMDVETGTVLSVTAGDVVPEGATPEAAALRSEMQSRAVVPGGCYGPPQQPCWNGTAYNVQFAGTGTDYGIWGSRTGYAAGPYTAMGCWDWGGTVCGSSISPYTFAYLSNVATGVSHSRW